MKLNENDLPKLKHLLKELRNSGSVYPEVLIDFFDKKDIENEFKRLGSILNKLNACDVNTNKIGGVVLLQNPHTFNFDLDQYIKENKEKDLKENLELELAKSNIEANKLNAKNSKFNMWTTIINILIGVLNVYLLISQ